jgi:hypothetical protein
MSNVPPSPRPDRTYAEARAEVDEKADAALRRFAHQVGVYYKALLEETHNHELASNAAERLSLMYESGMERAMNDSLDKANG